jgi:succinate dehydrogenase/fumarate reductase flavoprotein subunit
MIDEFADGEITDKDGVPVINKPLPIRDEAIKTIFNVIKEGRGTPHGGVYFDTTKSPKGEEAVREVFKSMTPKHYQFLIDAAGIDLAKEPLEVAPASHYQCGGIFINEKGQSTVDGLYACGEAAGNFQGANRLAGSALCDTQTTGAAAGNWASKDSKSRELIPINEKDLNEAIDMVRMITAPKTKKIKPLAVKTKILETMDKYIAPFRDEKGMKKGRSIIEDLKSQLKNLYAPDINKYNLEVSEAIEAKLMIDSAQYTFDSALFRTESRGHHNRTDYPREDNKNWRCHTIIKNKNGKPQYSKKDVIYTRMKPQD